jgi:predicted DNA-binding transcriptional regulator YafY
MPAQEVPAMPPKHDDATPGQKALALYSLLLFTGRRYTLTTLAEHLACSKQTILRLIRDMELRGDILEMGFEGKERWYKIKTPAQRPHLAITTQELQNLIMCRDMVSHLVPKAIRDTIDHALAATTTLLPDFDTRAQAFESHWRTECKGRIDYSGHVEMLATARQAIAEHGICRVAYTGVGKTQPREHLFAPLECVSYREALYLYGVKVKDDDITDPVGPMMLALHRISNLELTGGHHAHEDPDPQRSGFGIMHRSPVRLTVRFDNFAATYVRERTWSDDQEVEGLDDGGVRLRFTAANETEALSWVLSFGARAVVEAPEAFRDTMRGELTRMAKSYAPAKG